MSRSDALTKALPLLRALTERGFETVFVGGCVRDTLLGIPLKDVDIATAATPEQVVGTFARTIPTGLQHGTVTVVHEGETYEITTFRTESEYESFRRPSQVQFVTSLETDLLRRDFTINSMAMRADGELIDPFGGRDDLARGVLRCVGDADARLQEDALRILRAIRFAASYDLRIAHGTWRAIKRHRGLLAHIAMERIGLEADKMIGGGKPERAAALLAAGELLAFTKEKLPAAILEAASFYARKWREVRREIERLSEGDATNVGDRLSVSDAKDAGDRLPVGEGPAEEDAMNSRLLNFTTSLSEAARIGLALRQLPNLTDSENRWAALCASIEQTASEELQELFSLLRYSAARNDRLIAVLGVHAAMRGADRTIKREKERQDDDRLWIKTIIRFGKHAAGYWLDVIEAVPATCMTGAGDRSARTPAERDAYANKLRTLLREIPAAEVRDLAVKGKQLLEAIGKPAGPWLGALLLRLLHAVASGETQNERETLLAVAVRMMDEHA